MRHPYKYIAQSTKYIFVVKLIEKRSFTTQSARFEDFFFVSLVSVGRREENRIFRRIGGRHNNNIVITNIHKYERSLFD